MIDSSQPLIDGRMQIDRSADLAVVLRRGIDSRPASENARAASPIEWEESKWPDSS